MNRVDILQTAESLINGNREKDYGNARENFTRIGNLWSEILGIRVTPEQVALCMNQVKVARLVVTPDHKDSWIDGAGYFALGGEIATEPRSNVFDSGPGDVEYITSALLYTPGTPEPRIVDRLTEEHRDAQWLDPDGWRYRWAGPVGNSTPWRGLSSTTGKWYPMAGTWGPFTEILPE